MGQYHTVVNADKKFFYSPSSLGGGLKLLEQSKSLNTVASLMSLLANGWNGQRVFLLGDYAEKGDINGVDTDAIVRDIDTSYKNMGWMARKQAENVTGAHFVKESYSIRGCDGSTVKHHYYTTQFDDSFYVDDDCIAHGDNIDKQDDTTAVVFVNYTTKQKYTGEKDVTMKDIISDFTGDFATVVHILIAGSIRGGARGGGDADVPEIGGIWAGDNVGIIPASQAGDFEDITDKVHACNIPEW